MINKIEEFCNQRTTQFPGGRKAMMISNPSSEHPYIDQILKAKTDDLYSVNTGTISPSSANKIALDHMNNLKLKDFL